MTSTAVQNLVEIRPWGASWQIAEILTIFHFVFEYLYLPAQHLLIATNEIKQCNNLN